MKTIMIIDDEPLIRRGLESMLPWEEMGYRLIGQAANGEEGLAKIRDLHPDIVFTDIRMPKMDGLTMMKEALNETFPPIFIVLSGHNDFELVRSALRLGAVDYLMKLSLEESDLIRVIGEASQRLTTHQQTVSGSEHADPFKESFIRELLQGNSDQDFHRTISQRNFALREGCTYRIICLLLPSGDQAWSQMAQNFLSNLCREPFSDDLEAYHFLIGDGLSALYVESRDALPRGLLYEKCTSIESSIRQYFNQELNIGISASHRNMAHLRTALDEARQSIAFHIDGVEENIHFYTDLLNSQYFEEQLMHLTAESDFSEALENFILQLQKFISQKASRGEAVDICLKLISEIYRIDPNSPAFFRQWFGRDYHSVSDFEDLKDQDMVGRWLLRLEQGVISFGQQYMGEIYRFKVKKAKQYIFEHRFQKISLNEVAEQLEITPGYLSRIFKKVTQKSFSDYISEVKIHEAKKLLLQDNNRIYEVSTMLGYDDPYYFSKVFKRITQMTPSEYIARH